MTETPVTTYQFLTFMLDDEIYGINVLKIKEVLEVPKITKIPKSLPFMAGIINLRGSIIPLVDLRIKFDFPGIELTDNTVIIIVEVVYENEVIMMGVLADAVKKVIKLSQDNLEPPPKVGMNIATKYIECLGKNNDELIVIFDSDSLFSKEELTDISSISADSEQTELKANKIEEDV